VAVTSAGAALQRTVIRTCIGCRQRVIAVELLRVVAGPVVRSSAGQTAQVVLPDPRRRASGRGAWLHPALECVELAERRRAFGRALHTATSADPASVREYIETLVGHPSR
jgi:predicted RNA-binding protein YlxR (DUF448 family)